MNEEEFKKQQMTGALFGPKDVRDYRIVAGAAQVAEFPKTFELKMRYVKNQMNVSSCVAHSIAEVVEYHNFQETNKDIIMSTGWIYGNRRETNYKGEGMYTRDAVATACKYGCVPLTVLPYNHEVPEAIKDFEDKYPEFGEYATKLRFSYYYRTRKENEIKQALLKDGPVVFAIEWYKDNQVVKGVIQRGKQKSGGHCMVIYGWDETGWKILNSWGLLWGNGGKAILPYDYPIEEAYGIADDILEDRDDIVKPYEKNWFTKAIAKILNFFSGIITTIKNFFNKK